MSTTASGRAAEELVAEHLQDEGHRIIAMNWRTRWCEIDIVSRDSKCVYFTEVKYRSNTAWGGGFDYIGGKKLKQMNFAAELWIAENKWQKESQLVAAEVNDQNKIKIVFI